MSNKTLQQFDVHFGFEIQNLKSSTSAASRNWNIVMIWYILSRIQIWMQKSVITRIYFVQQVLEYIHVYYRIILIMSQTDRQDNLRQTETDLDSQIFQTNYHQIWNHFLWARVFGPKIWLFAQHVSIFWIERSFFLLQCFLSH